MTYTHTYNWLILIAISLAGALVRVYFVARHKGKPSVIPIILALLLLTMTALAIKPPATHRSEHVNTTSNSAVFFAQVQDIIQQRCTGCHASTPTQAGFASPPKGIIFPDANHILHQASAIHQQTVVTQAMPIGNLTAMTAAERRLIDQWFQRLRASTSNP